jgi:membrane protease YdiL (CAAX protease family)
MGTTATPIEKNRGKEVLVIIIALTFILTTLFWVGISIFQVKGYLSYFMTLGLYVIFYLIAWWGLKQEHITLSITGRKVLEALAWSLVGWLLFVLLIQLLGLARLPAEFQTLKNTPAREIGMMILGTWFFIGLGEEVLFRGYFLKAFLRHFTSGTDRRRMVAAVLFVSAFFSLWHLPIRITWLISGELDPVMLLVSLLTLFLIGIGFAYLFIRSENILLVGLVHGLMDYPLVGKESQMTPTILVVAIICVEITRWIIRKKAEAIHQ